MTHNFSFALLVRRIFDSEPTEGRVSFLADGVLLDPVQKPGGLYVFSDCAARRVQVCARGYQPEAIEPSEGEVTQTYLYPSAAYCPPSGWKLVTGSAPPGTVLIAEDASEIRLLSCDTSAGEVRLWMRRGFLGGALVFSGGAGRELAQIAEKKPPDWFLLARRCGDYTGGCVARVYPARADDQGVYAAVLPEVLEEHALKLWKEG